MAGGSVPHHLLGDYLRSFVAVLLTQFSRKRFPGGMDGVVRLAEKCEPIQASLGSSGRGASKWAHPRAPHSKLRLQAARLLLGQVLAEHIPRHFPSMLHASVLLQRYALAVVGLKSSQFACTDS